MGGGSCPYERKCDEDAERHRLAVERKRQLDDEEQRLRIELLKKQINGELPVIELEPDDDSIIGNATTWKNVE